MRSFIVYLLLSVPACGTTLTVCNSGCPYSSAQEAFNVSRPGDTILLTAGQNHGSLTMPGGTHDLTIKSSLIDTYPRGYRITRNHAALATLTNISIGDVVLFAPLTGVPTLNVRTMDGNLHGLHAGDTVVVGATSWDAYNCSPTYTGAGIPGLNQPPYVDGACDAFHAGYTNIRTDTGLTNGAVVRFGGNPPPPPLKAGTDYYIVNFGYGGSATVADRFNVSDTPGGAPIVIPQFNPSGTPFNIAAEPLPARNGDTLYVLATGLTATTLQLGTSPEGPPITFTQAAKVYGGSFGVFLIHDAPSYNLTFDGLNVTSTATHLVDAGKSVGSNYGENHSFRFLRSWFHGDPNRDQEDFPYVGIELVARASEVGWCIFEGITNTGGDSQGIHLGSTGNVYIHDNEIYGTTEGIMSGGNLPWFAGGRNASGIRVERNYIHKNLRTFIGITGLVINATQFQLAQANIRRGGDCAVANADLTLSGHCFAYEEDDTNPQAPLVTRTEWSKSLADSTFTLTVPLDPNPCTTASFLYAFGGAWGCGYVYMLRGVIHMDHNFSGTVTCPDGVICTHQTSQPSFPIGSTRIGIAVPQSAAGFWSNSYAGFRSVYSKNGVESKDGDYWNIEGNEFRHQDNCDGGTFCQNVGVQLTVAINGSGPAEPVNFTVGTSYSTVKNNIFEQTASGVGAVGKSFPGYYGGTGYNYEAGGFGSGSYNNVINNLFWDMGSAEQSVSNADGQIIPGMLNTDHWVVAHNTAADIRNGFTANGGSSSMTFHSNVIIPYRAKCLGMDGCTRPAPTSVPGVLSYPGSGLTYYPTFAGLGWFQALAYGLLDDTSQFMNNLMMNRMGNYVNSGVPNHYPSSTYLIQYSDKMGDGPCDVYGDPGCPDPSRLFKAWHERDETLPPDGDNYRASDFRLAPGMAAAYPAYDARAIGADIDEIEALTGKAGVDVERGRPRFSDRVSRQISAAATSAVLSYVPNGSTCTIQVWPNAAYSGTPTVDISDAGADVLGGVTFVELAGLQRGTSYFGKRWCGSEVDVFSFSTALSTPSLVLQFAPPAGTAQCQVEYGSTPSLGSSTSAVDVANGTCTIAAPSAAYWRSVYRSPAGEILSQGNVQRRSL